MEIEEVTGDHGQVISVKAKGLQEFIENKQRVWDLVKGLKCAELAFAKLDLQIILADSGCCWNIIALIRDELTVHAVIGATFVATCVGGDGEIAVLLRDPGGEVKTISIPVTVKK